MGVVVEGSFKREGILIYIWPIHVVQQKPTQHWKAIILQFKNLKKKQFSVDLLFAEQGTAVLRRGLWARRSRGWAPPLPTPGDPGARADDWLMSHSPLSTSCNPMTGSPTGAAPNQGP